MKNEQASNQLIITLIINVAEKCLKLNESIRMMKSARLDIERNKVIEDGKGWEMMKLLNKMKKLINNIEIEIQKDI